MLEYSIGAKYKGGSILRKYKFDKKYMKIAMYSFAVLASCILLMRFLDNIGAFFGSIRVFVDKVADILITFIYGFFIAFFFTPLVNFLEKFIGGHSARLSARPKTLRNITIFITYAIFIGCFIWLMIYMIPTIIQSFNSLVVSLPQNMESLMERLPEMFSGFDEETRESAIKVITRIANPIQKQLNNLPIFIEEHFNGENIKEFVSSTVNVASAIINFIIGIIISFYMLATKESIASSCKKFCYATLDEGKSEQFIQNMQRVNVIFQNFVLGKLLDAIALGILCFVGMVILRIPYAVAISVIIGVSNMIPYIGPFIGTVPAVFIVLLVDPIKAVWLLIYIIAIQQVDNYIICPKLLGDPTGLTPLQVLFAIAVGAYFGGAFGMFIGVPVVASIKLFVSEAINRRYREKYPHGSPGLSSDDDDDLWDSDDDDFVEDIPDD